MSIYSVYRVTNLINGKIYIGKTNNLEKRKLNHKHASKKEDTAFYRALNKYGWENFLWEIVCQTLNENDCYELEKYFILEYNSYTGNKYSNGYNMTLGGDGFTSEFATKNIVRLKQTEEYWEQRKEIGRKMTETKTHPFFGGEIQKEKVKKGIHHFLDPNFHKKHQSKRIKEKTHNLLNFVSCYDAFGNFIKIPKEQYHSQTGPKETWDFVHNNSSEGKIRRQSFLNKTKELKNVSF